MPKLLKISDNIQKLEQRIANTKGVKRVRINSIAESIVIEYQESQISELDLQKQLATILISIYPNFDETRSQLTIAIERVDNLLTPYEQQQIEQIERWRSQEPEFLVAIAAQTIVPLKTLSDLIIPERATFRLEYFSDRHGANALKLN